MKPTTFVLLAIVTLVVTVAAVFAILERPTTAPVRYVDEPAFPELREDPDAIAKVTVTTAEGSFTLLRETAGRWVAPDRFGYPVDAAKVRELVVGLADMRLIERKTAMPERYVRLEVENVDAPEASSRLLRLETVQGDVRAEVLIGKERTRLTGTEASGTYLRRPGEADSWLASGSVPIDPELIDWLDREVVDIEADRVSRAEVTPVDEPTYVVRRAAPDEPLTLIGLAAGETLAEDANLDDLASALAFLRFEDVKPRDQLSWPAVAHTARMRTFDGLELTVRLAKIDDKTWAMFDARDVAPTAPPTASEGADEGDVSADDEGPEAEADETAPEDTPPADAATLNDRLGQWAYQVPEHVFERLTTPRADLVTTDPAS